MSVHITWPLLAALLSAFGYNLLISALATLLGIPAGWGLSHLTQLTYPGCQPIARLLQSVFCHVPSFVLLFYLTLVLPSQFELMGGIWSISPLMKSVFALSIPVTGYSCDAFRQQRQGHQTVTLAALRQFFIVILMSSTTASVIGVPEILATANTYVASTGDAATMLPIYLLVTTIFVLSGFMIHLLFIGFAFYQNQKQAIHKQATLAGHLPAKKVKNDAR